MEEADRIKRRLLLMDHDRDGRLSMEEWKIGAIADAGIKQLLACVGIHGVNLAPEPARRSLPQHLEEQRSCIRCRRDESGERRLCLLM